MFPKLASGNGFPHLLAGCKGADSSQDAGFVRFSSKRPTNTPYMTHDLVDGELQGRGNYILGTVRVFI